MRVDKKMLEQMVRNLNGAMGRPEYPNPGCLVLNVDMTGYQLTMVEKSGGEREIIGRCSAKEMWHAL